MEQLADAVNAFSHALALRSDSGQHHLIPEPLAGLAYCALVGGQPEQAMAYVENVLACLESGTLDGAQEPLWIYLTCYHVLRDRRNARASKILDAAYGLLQERASRINDEQLRRSFLTNVQANVEIIRCWQALR
jgi:hypothetical protein